MKEIFHSQANVTYFLEKDCAFGLILKARVLELGIGLLDFFFVLLPCRTHLIELIRLWHGSSVAFEIIQFSKPEFSSTQ